MATWETKSPVAGSVNPRHWKRRRYWRPADINRYLAARLQEQAEIRRAFLATR